MWKTPVCTFKTPPCVRSKRPRVYRHQAHMYEKCGLGAGTHADVLNVHTETRSMQTPVPPPPPPLSQHTQPQAAHRPQAHRPQAPLLMVTFRQCLQVSALRPYSTQTRIQIMCRHRGCKTTHNTQHRRQKINTYPFSPSLEKWSSRQM